MEELRKYGKNVHYHVTEVYSPPRVTKMAERLKMMPGMALDLTGTDEEGNAWDFNVEEMREKAERIVRERKALLLIGSPMCSAFSALQSINFAKMEKEDVDRVVEYGMRHLEFAMKLYRIQMENGLYFLHEHPNNAKVGERKW